MSSVNDNARKIFSLRYLRESFFLDILLHLNKDFALLFIFYLMTYFTCKYFLKCPQVFCIQPAFFSLRLILWKASFPAPNHLRTSIYRGLSIYYYCFLQLLLCATKLCPESESKIHLCFSTNYNSFVNKIKTTIYSYSNIKRCCNFRLGFNIWNIVVYYCK